MRPVLIIILLAVCAIADARTMSVNISADKGRIGMGRSVIVSAIARLAGDKPAVGYELLPYVNGKRWGAHEYADESGRAVFMIPLPNVGIQEIQVQARPAAQMIPESWIWTADVQDNQDVILRKEFSLPSAARFARVWLAVDDGAKLFINGQEAASKDGWMDIRPISIRRDLLKAGTNEVQVEARNSVGPAGVLVRMEVETASGKRVICSDGNWTAESGKVVVLGKPGSSIWTTTGWPNVADRSQLFTGALLPANAVASNTIQVQVDRRKLQPPPKDPDHLLGMQWEPWFTPLNCSWGTAYAVPLMGFYWSANPDVTRQHMIWLAESGVDFLVVDWTNQLWDKQHFDERTDGANEIMHSTTMALEVLAQMRDEGLPVPKMVIYLGVTNGPSTTMVAINEEIAWIYNNYIRNPRFKGLFVEYLGKPLLMIHNGGGPQWLVDTKQIPVDDSHFTIRWQSFMHENSHHNEAGYWSWMNKSLNQPVTYYEGKPEGATISTAFFAEGGWKKEGAYGRRGGWTYLESFKDVDRYRPRFVELHQFNEFAGAPEGQGYGPEHDIYVDSYSVELSDDIEPVSLTTPAYRGNGGWGFQFLNLTRALVDLYRQKTPETTVLALWKPDRRQVVTGNKLDVAWAWAGKQPKSFSISLNGKTVLEDLQDMQASVDLSGIKDGPVRLRLTAEGTKARYLISYTEDSLPQKDMKPAFAKVDFMLKRGATK